MIRRLAVGLAAVALAALSGTALAGEDPPPAPCATGGFTSYRVQEVNYIGMGPQRIFIYAEGSIGPCDNGAPLPAGFRLAPYYRDGAVVHYTEEPDPFTSDKEPTPFGGYFGVDVERPYFGPAVAFCLGYDPHQLTACLAIEFPKEGMDPPTLVPVAPSWVLEHVSPWPPHITDRNHTHPTCGTCP